MHQLKHNRGENKNAILLKIPRFFRCVVKHYCYNTCLR